MIFAIYIWLLVINGGIQSITAGTSELAEVPICCPAADWKLARISRGIFRSDNFTCVPPPNKGGVSDNTSMPFENSYPVFGYGIIGPNDNLTYNTVVPCDDKKYVEFAIDKDFEIPPQSCLMGIDDRHVAVIACPPKSSDTLKPFRFIHKCCPNNYFYDGNLRRCIKDAINVHLYQNLFKHFSIFATKPIVCPREKVLVEYQLNTFKFFVGNGHLYMRDLNKKFDFPEYCIEAIEQSNTSQDQQFLVRVCDDVASTCRRMPCIRRCCKDGEMIARGNATSYCKRDETDIGFQSFESLQINGNFTKPSGKYIIIIIIIYCILYYI